MKLFPHRRLLPVAFVAVLLSCTGDSPTDAGPTPAQVQATGGSGQTGETDATLPGALVARVTDRGGSPVSGVAVVWRAAPGAGTLSAAAVPTDSNGEARANWTLGPSAGTFTVTASVAGLTPATFTATAAVPPPARVDKMAGDGQVGAPAGPLPDSLAVRVTSASGRPVPGATVSWSVAAGQGSLGAATSTTDAGGIAKAVWTLGAAGAGTVTAGVGTLPPVTFTATAVPVASVSISHASAGVGRGDTLRLAATPRDAAGGPLARRVVKWSSSAPSTASVDEAGVVSGLAYGKATITATSEGQSASATITVTSEDRTAPKLTGLSYSPATVDVTSAAATVEFTLSITDAGSGVQYFGVGFAGPTQGSGVSCGTYHPSDGVLASGSPQDGVWKCTATIPRGTAQGTWVMPQLDISDHAGNHTAYTMSQLRAAGFPTTLTVVNSGPAPTPPQLTGLTFSPDPANVSTSDATVDIVFSATASAGVKQVYAFVHATRGEPRYMQGASCYGTTRTGGTETSGTWKCTIRIRKSSAAGTWTVNTLWVQDNLGNTTQAYDAKKLADAGFPGSFQVVSANEDVTAPTLTALSVNPTTASVANGAMFVTFTITGTDQGTGMVRAQAALIPPGSAAGAMACSGDSQVPGPLEGITFRCAVPLSQSAVAGTWSVNSVMVIDAVGNHRSYSTAELKAAGFPYEVAVVR